MGNIHERVQARALAFDRLNSLTTWIAAGALVAVGVFAAIAAATIPGKASPTQDPSAQASSSSSTSTPLSSSLGATYAPRHHHDSGTSSVSASSGPPMAVTGSSH